MKIDWNFPEACLGIEGGINKFCGLGATRLEMILQSVVPIKTIS